METKEWNERYNLLVEETLSQISAENECSTPADTGLALRVVSDYLESDGENVERDVMTIRLASKILSAKHQTEDLPWFDVYDCMLLNGSKMKFSRSDRSREPVDADDIEDVYLINEDVESQHASEFIESAQKLVEMATSEDVEWLRESSDKDVDEYDPVSSLMRNRVGFLLGSVEMPNNMSRAKVINLLVDEFEKELKEKDFRWMMHQLREWLRMYVHAEATVANRATSQDELREFMMEEETPAEKYF